MTDESLTDRGCFRLLPSPTRPADLVDVHRGLWTDVEFDEDGGCNVVVNELRCPHCETVDTETEAAGARFGWFTVECVDCSGWDVEEFGPYTPGCAEIGGDL